MRSRVCEYATTATCPVSASSPIRCSAKLSRAPGNHVAPGMRSDAITDVYGACALTPEKSQIDDQKPVRSSTDQRWSSS